MKVNTEDFPFVWTYMQEEGLNNNISPLEQFDSLLNRNEPFIMLNDEGLSVGEFKEDRQHMHQISRWVKVNRIRLTTLVKASIYIESDENKHLSARKIASSYEKLWGYPFLIAASKEEAIQIGRKLLSLEN
ncbi:hypothetical protein KJY74_25040 [Klebsiella pneumoniae subsp. pneumoniae]|uniref:hypothetical protein n=1 Tax=Klebsiella TaxID=570 RepID=UPI000F4F1914|nr:MULTISPECIES: hypothetical protein [Klebsiella]AYW18936.1 hypothetical protein DTA24_09855 [Klebsiella sp. P1CD1]MCT6795101.1 hypothetical protein [Klebsiella pneumoniae subsp. pneumoniae]